MKLLTLLSAKAAFGFKSEGKGRTIQVFPNEVFEVMTSQTFAAQNGAVRIARKGKGKLGLGWLFSLEQVAQLFNVV